jgi:hypothetical protein
LVHPFGLIGVALGTLIPTTIENLCFVLPYAMRANGVDFRTILQEIYLPVLLPAVPMSAVLYLLRETIRPDSFVAIAIIGCAGLLVYVSSYVLIGAGTAEREFSRDTVRAVIQFTRTHLGRARSDT